MMTVFGTCPEAIEVFSAAYALRAPPNQARDALATMAGTDPAQIVTEIFSLLGDIDRAVRAMKNGAFEFIEKPYVEEHLLATLDNAFGELDRRVNAFGLLDDAKLRIAKLSKRERQVMQGLLDGLPNKLIAYHLGLSIRAGVSMDDPVDLISFEKTA
jgi:two-component system response regulator FixJ